MKKQQVFLYTLLISAFIFACFTPGNISFTRLENFVLPLVMIALAALPKVKIPIGMAALMLIYFLLTLMTNFMNSLEFGAYMYGFRMFKYLLFFIFAANIYNSDYNVIDQTIRVVVLVTSIVVLIHLFNPYGLGDIIHSFYTPRSPHDFLVRRSRRILGVMANPNDNAVFLLCLSAYFMSAYYYFKRKTDILFVLLCAAIIVMAQSRTTLIALGVMFMVFVFQYKLNWKLILGVFAIIILSISMVYLFEMNYLKELLTKNPVEIPAFTSRFRTWKYMLEVWNENVLFGVGPFTDQMDAYRNAPDSEYLYVLASNGILGLISYIAIIIYPIILFWKHRRSTHSLIGILIPIAFLFIGVTNFTILNVRIGLIYFILLAIPFSGLLKDGYNFKGIMVPKGFGLLNIGEK